MTPSSPASAAAAEDTPRRMTRALAKSLGGTDSPAPSPSQQRKSPASTFRKKAAATAAQPAQDQEPSSGTIGGSSDDGLVVVEQPASPEVIVLDSLSDDDELEAAPAPAEPIEAELFAASQAVPAAADEDEEEDDEDEDEKADGSSSVEGSSSSSDDSSSDEDSDDDDDEPAAPALDDDALEALLSEAYLAADARTASKSAATAGEEVILQLDQQKDKPLPALSVPDLPEAYFSIHFDGRVTRGPPAPRTASTPAESTNAVASSSKLAPTAAATPELDTFALPAQLSKKAQKAARKANAPLGWAELPPIPDDRRKDMTREYHALRLRNALDPKRHYKGQGSSKTVPEVFAIGKLYEPSKVLASSTLAPAAAARPGSIVRDILADSSSRAYAKRKFGALQSERERNGRKKTTKKPRQ